MSQKREDKYLTQALNSSDPDGLTNPDYFDVCKQYPCRSSVENESLLKTQKREDKYPKGFISPDFFDCKSMKFDEGGLKYDSGKIDWSLMPIEAMEEVIKVFQFGEQKYQRFNFRKGFDTNRLVAANMRHLLAWQKGEDLDPESQLSHIAHNVCTGLMLLQNLLEGKAKDGRYMEAK